MPRCHVPAGRRDPSLFSQLKPGFAPFEHMVKDIIRRTMLLLALCFDGSLALWNEIANSESRCANVGQSEGVEHGFLRAATSENAKKRLTSVLGGPWGHKRAEPKLEIVKDDCPFGFCRVPTVRRIRDDAGVRVPDSVEIVSLDAT